MTALDQFHNDEAGASANVTTETRALDRNVIGPS